MNECHHRIVVHNYKKISSPLPARMFYRTTYVHMQEFQDVIGTLSALFVKGLPRCLPFMHVTQDDLSVIL